MPTLQGLAVKPFPSPFADALRCGRDGSIRRLLPFPPENDPEVTMENARNFEGQRSLGHPQNQVYAVFDKSPDAGHAASHLNEGGFGPEKVGLLQGAADAGKLADATGEEGFWAKLSHFGLDFGDQDNPYMQQYKQELERGRTVLAVVTESDAEVEKVQQILAEHHARFLTKYGKWAVEAARERQPGEGFAKRAGATQNRIKAGSGRARFWLMPGGACRPAIKPKGHSRSKAAQADFFRVPGFLEEADPLLALGGEPLFAFVLSAVCCFVSPFSARCLLTMRAATSSSRPS